MVETTTRWLETYPVPHATTKNTVPGVEKQVLWWHGILERTESEKGTNIWKKNSSTWAKERGIEWVCHTCYHAPASRKIEKCNGLLKTILRVMSAGAFKLSN